LIQELNLWIFKGPCTWEMILEAIRTLKRAEFKRTFVLKMPFACTEKNLKRILGKIRNEAVIPVAKAMIAYAHETAHVPEDSSLGFELCTY
jgi:hypothetical protein